jgi:bacterioferritin-associated ferredoxin
MYVCVCNAVTDRQIRSQSESTRGTVAEIYRALGIKVKCGKCVRTAKCIIAEMQPDGCPGASTCAMTDDQIGAPQPGDRSGVSLPVFAMTDNRMDVRPSETRSASAIPAFAMAD